MRNSSERWVKIGSTIRITNFRSCKDVEQYINSLLTENPLLLEPKTRSMIDYKAIEPSITLITMINQEHQLIGSKKPKTVKDASNDLADREVVDNLTFL